ncbi:MAG: TetR/AcrR family transcriptional regulator [Streptosporangiaceae bacterium]
MTAGGRPRSGGQAQGERRPVGARRTGGRRPGDSGTREAISEAARAQFAERGYQGATIRSIAAAAGVDPALVYHFYDSKESLFAAAMRVPVVPSEVLSAALAGAGVASSGGAGAASGPGGGAAAGAAGEPGGGAAAAAAAAGGRGEVLVRTALAMWESPELKEPFLGLFRSAVTSDRAAVMLREFIGDSILATLARVTGLTTRVSAAEADYRVALAATQMLGLALTRLVLGIPQVAQASIDELAASAGPGIDRYLFGDIVIPERLRGTPQPAVSDAGGPEGDQAGIADGPGSGPG